MDIERNVLYTLVTVFITHATVAVDPHYSIFLNHHEPRTLFDVDFNNQFPQQYHSHPSFDFSSSNGLFPNAQPPSFPQLPQPQPPPPTPDPSTLGCGRAPTSCPKTPYRSYDGSCNNLRNPVLGTPQTRYARLLPPKYGDGISSPATAKSGRPLPSARTVSLVLFPDVKVDDPKWTLNAMQYGQIITHDMAMIAGSTQAQPHGTRCCSPTGQLLEFANIPEHCYPIVLANDDPISRQTNIKCMNFVRTITDRDRRCVGGHQPAEQLTAVNHYLDLSLVYGNTDQMNQQLRQFRGGRLLVETRNSQDWPPRNSNASGVCSIRSPQEPCYAAGDARVNQNPQLTVLQVILLREHNRIADALAKLNPHWDDETLFQEARKIAIAEHQYISYYEWLPIFIGLENSMRNKIIYNTRSFINDYNGNVDPSIINEHSTAAFRYFHSAIAGGLDLVTEHRSSYGNLRLSDWFNRPGIIEEGNNFADLCRGLGTQPELMNDQYHDSEITQFLFRDGMQFGMDLKAFDVQRNRDHGLASYNDMRAYCGLKKAHVFEDFLDVISSDNVNKLSQLYEDPDDVDLTVGGTLEAHVPGTLAGPTFLCILTEQFYRSRVGDRFWFENGNRDTGFTLDQLNEIRKTSIARVICDNSKDVRSMQPRAFERISHSNAVVPCESLPSVDLSLWKDSNGGFPSSSSFKNDFQFGSDEFFFKK